MIVNFLCANMSGGFTKSSIRKYELLTGNIFSKYVLKIMNVKSKAGCVTFWMDT